MARSTLVFASLMLLASSAVAQQPAPPTAPARAPAPLAVPNPHYATVLLNIEVNAPVDKVWARIGKFCDIGEWGIPGCTLLSGDGNLGSVRSSANGEIMVAQTKYSYTYTQPVRQGVPFNMYHGTLEAVALTPTTTRLNYSMIFDDSMLADDAARETAISSRKTRFTGFLQNMKVLAEGGTLSPGALGGAATQRPANRQ